MSSSTSNAGDGCAGVFGFFGFVLIAGAVLHSTNPSMADHKAAFAKNHPNIAMGVDAMQWIGLAEVQYHDCLLFSYVTCKVPFQETPKPISAGALGTVYSGE
jgi:hypothetical protein